jgi:hypothetical protein
MKKINLKTFKEVLSDKELKEVMAGSGTIACTEWDCKQINTCTNSAGVVGHCKYIPFGSCTCLGHA